MKKLLLVLVPVLFLALGWLVYRKKAAPPQVPFARVVRETVVSSLVTNGKAEPYEWQAVLAQRSGVVETDRAGRGAHVKQGDLLVELGAKDARAELSAAEARLAQVRAELQLFKEGGRASDLAALDGEISRARLELEVARKEQASLDRLAAKQAATRLEATEAARRVERAELQLQDFVKRRAALVDPADKSAAEAKVREAETSVELARQNLDKALIRAPISGIVYDSDVRLGSFLNPGDTVAKVGRIDKVRIRVYVDEPELGRVAPAMPVTITWDALPGRRWQGAVERMPTEIVALGTRQVGEVVCVIDNPGQELIPGTNINAEIRTGVAENALSIPREALRRRGNGVGVFLLQGNQVAWRAVAPGISSITRTQIVEGLSEGNAVALPADVSLSDGTVVRPVFR